MLRQVRRTVAYYQALARDPRTPLFASCLLFIALAYLLTPIDLIPDFIPLFGQIDDLIIVSGLIWLALRFVSEDVIREHRPEQPDQNDAAPDALR